MSNPTAGATSRDVCQLPPGFFLDQRGSSHPLPMASPGLQLPGAQPLPQGFVVAGLAGDSVPALQGLPPGSTVHYLVQQPSLAGGRQEQEVMQEREARRRGEQELVQEKGARRKKEQELKQEKEARRREQDELVQELMFEKEARRKVDQELARERESRRKGEQEVSRERDARRRAEKDLMKETEGRRRGEEESLKEREKRKQLEQLLAKEKEERRKEVNLEREAKLEVEDKLQQEKNGKRKLNMKLFEERTLLRNKAHGELAAEKEKRRSAETKGNQYKEDKKKLELKLHEERSSRSKAEKALEYEKEKIKELETKVANEKNRRGRAEAEYVKKKVELEALKVVETKLEKAKIEYENLDDSGVETKEDASVSSPSPLLTSPAAEQNKSRFKFSHRQPGPAPPSFLPATGLSGGQLYLAGAPKLSPTGAPQLYLAGAAAPCSAAAEAPPLIQAGAGGPPVCSAGASLLHPGGLPQTGPVPAGVSLLSLAGAPLPCPAGSTASKFTATAPWPRPQGPPGPSIDNSLFTDLHFASQCATEVSEDEINAEDENIDEKEPIEHDDKPERKKPRTKKVSSHKFMSDESDEEENTEDCIEEDEHIDEKKRPQKPKKKKDIKVKPVPLEGPYELDEDKLERDHKDSPEHIEVIKNFPRLAYEIFNPVDKRIPASKNPKFLNLLFNSQDAEETLAAYQLTRESYELKYGEKFVPLYVQPTHGATGGRGKDTVQSGIKNIKSEVWVCSITTVFNMFIEFVQDKQEFRFVNWFIATAAEIDIIFGHFLVWLAPQEGGSSLGGTRYTTKTLKQIKTKMQNMLKHLLKRSDLDINSPTFCFTQNMYSMKRNRTAEEPMEGLEGDRERKAFEEEDKAKLDLWRTLPLDQIMDPEELTLKAAAIILEGTCGRGVTMQAQIRRSMVVITTDKRGRKQVRIRGNVKRKTMQGRSDNYAPLDKTIYGEFEVALLEKLVSHLPPPGCKHCVHGCPPAPLGQHNLCTCDELYLQSLPAVTWRPTNLVWFSRQRRGTTWHKNLVAAISCKAGLAQRYTNSSFRPTTITELLMAGFTNREIGQFTGQKNHHIIEQYKRKLEMMSLEEKRGASVLMTPSGRRALRGDSNLWGDIDTEGGEEAAVGALGRKHKRAVQEKQGLDSLARQGPDAKKKKD